MRSWGSPHNEKDLSLNKQQYRPAFGTRVNWFAAEVDKPGDIPVGAEPRAVWHTPQAAALINFFIY